MLANVIETTDRNTLFKYFLQKSNPSKNKENSKIGKDRYIVSVPTVGVDVYEMEL